MKLFYHNGKTYLFSTLLFMLFFVSAKSQTTLTTNFTNNNGFALVTMNFTNNNAGAVIITDIASICGVSGTQQVAAFYKASAINGAPGPIDAGNGWVQFGSATITGIGNTTTTVTQPFMSGLTLVVPAGATYGLAVQATDLRYSTVAAGTYTTTGGGCVLTSGSNISYAGDAAPAAPTFTPRGFIGSITFTGATACTGTPDPGSTISTVNPVCPNINFTLTTQNSTPGSGVTYQWQSSPDGTAWTNITGATGASYSTSQTVATYYRANVTCAGNTTASAQLQVTINPPSSCYCIPPASNCNLDDEILNVTAAGINNNSACGTNGYTDYTATVAAGTVAAGLNMPMSVSVGPGGTEYVGVWIDYNQNGEFEATEFALLGSGNGVTISGIVPIAVNATVGLTRMRVRVRYNTTLTGTNACLGYTFGETEDYAINITPCIPGTISTQPAATVTSYCSGNASITVAAAGTALTYQWQERLNATSPWTIVANGGIYSGASTATLTLTDLTTNFNGRQYRVAIGGSCTPLFLSNTSTLAVGPLVASVNPTSATICNGAIQQLSLTATAPPTTLTLSSGPITMLVPDNNPAGANNTITTNAVPAGAIVTGIKVRFNMGHTWPGDLAFVLKAPNGNILNLNYFISATGAGPGTGFVNTTISSQTSPVLPLLSSTGSPYTGTFRPDAVVTPAAGNPPAGPTAFIPNTALFANLFSVPNGNWTLAVYDAFAGDEGTLTSWSIDLTYGAPFSGIWTPETGLFTDAAATIPYVAGSQANTVYAAPAVTTSYSVTISTPNCNSAPTVIPVTVANSISNVTAPANTAICVGGNTSFSVSAANGNPITYQWQLSTDAGASWTDIANGGVYSGATTSTLNITGAPANFNNNQYRATLTVAACSSSVNSGAATLTVNPLPVIVINAAPYTKLYPGITTTITAAVSPNAAVTYQWYKNGIAVPGATNATIVVDVDNLGDYSVMVDDVNGCSNGSASLTISEAANDILFIYPSPNTGQFQVRYYNLAGNSVNPRTLSIYDSKGARVYSRTYNITLPYSRMDVDMSNYSKGIYRVELGDLNGKRIKTGSVVIL